MRLPFRADIEGLRAVAILLVVCAHARVPWLAGGFVGVDVFFVLSGYLITGLLVREFEATGKLDLVAFYARRLQRLLPALLLLIVCTVLAAMVLLAPFEQLPQARAAGAAATWTSNFHFALGKLDYFGPAADTNLFLHTWSLGVEEQFYLLWPALMLFLLGAWRWQGMHRHFQRLKRGMMAAIAICFLLSVLLTYASPQLGFYMVLSRGWQFALGALVFLQFDRNTAPMDGRRPAATIVGGLGLLAIVSSTLVLDQSTHYPGFWAILPSLGTAAVVYAGGTTPSKVETSRLLAAGPMQAIGRVSYAWYLWHWPTLLLGLTLLDADNPWHLLALVLLSLALAAISYHLVESPLRRSTMLRSRPRAVLAWGSALMLAAFVGATGWSQLSKEWAHQPNQERFTRLTLDKPAIYTMDCHAPLFSAEVKTCKFGNQNAEKSVVLIGDSIAAQWFPAVLKIFDQIDWQVIVITKSACPMVDSPIHYSRIGRRFMECEQWRSAAIASLDSIKPDLVLLSSSSKYAYPMETWISGTSSVLSAISESTDRIALILPTPVVPFDAAPCIARQDWRRRIIGNFGGCTAVNDDLRLQAIHSALTEAVLMQPDARVVDLSDAICPKKECSAERNGTPVYRDDQHLAASFAETLADALRIGLDVPFSTKSDAQRHHQPQN